MQLNELIESKGLEAVSEKTNISIDNLNRLVNEDFEGLNRVKALGFLSILQREYGLELDSIENSIRSYFEQNTPNTSEPILVSIDKSDKGSGFFKWLIILTFLGGIGYLYNSGKLDKLLGQKEGDKNSTLNDTEALKSNVSEDNAQKNIVIKKDANKTEVEIKTAPLLIATTTTESNQSETNSSTKDEIKIVVEVPKKDKNGTKEEENKTIAISKDAGIEAPQEIKEVIDADSSDTTQIDTNQTITNITINPTRGMLWYGFINIDTGKKKEFMKNESTPFELNGGRWILTTGHGFLDIVSDMKTVEVSDRVRHYFYIDSKEIREITRAEFKKLNHGRMW